VRPLARALPALRLVALRWLALRWLALLSVAALSLGCEARSQPWLCLADRGQQCLWLLDGRGRIVARRSVPGARQLLPAHMPPALAPVERASAGGATRAQLASTRANTPLCRHATPEVCRGDCRAPAVGSNRSALRESELAGHGIDPSAVWVGGGLGSGIPSLWWLARWRHGSLALLGPFSALREPADGASPGNQTASNTSTGNPVRDAPLSCAGQGVSPWASDWPVTGPWPRLLSLSTGARLELEPGSVVYRDLRGQPRWSQGGFGCLRAALLLSPDQ
jgi:hypothetical protein